jgi:DNA-binding response OmpR family regulator
MSDEHTGDQPLVLVADDDMHILELVELSLRHAGYSVLTTTDGAQAVELAREHQPRLCVLDVMMPGIDGLEVARRIGDDDRTARTPILFLTATERAAITAAGFPAGRAEYLQKPFTPAALQARVLAIVSWEGTGTPSESPQP